MNAKHIMERNEALYTDRQNGMLFSELAKKYSISTTRCWNLVKKIDRFGSAHNLDTTIRHRKIDLKISELQASITLRAAKVNFLNNEIADLKRMISDLEGKR